MDYKLFFEKPSSKSEGGGYKHDSQSEAPQFPTITKPLFFAEIAIENSNALESEIQ